MNKSYIDWNQVDKLISRLSYWITTSDLEFENIYGLQRGGLIPAVMFIP